MAAFTPGALCLVPEYRERVWGGRRLKPGPAPIGEAWIVYDQNRIAAGPAAGMTLAEVVAERGPALLGERVAARTGGRFPLLIKLLDTAEWLSLQVHPDDEQAEQLEGPGASGKTEAWHIIDAESGAKVISGFKPGTGSTELAEAIRTGTILDLVQYLPVRPGDTIFTAAGTVHALGPGLLLFEVQQSSDITYRVYDWGRPQTKDRALHIDKSLAVANPAARGRAAPLPSLLDGDCRTLIDCEHFTLDIIAAQAAPVSLDTGGESFQTLTVIEGEAAIEGDGWRAELSRFDSAVVPATSGRYQLSPGGVCRVLKSAVPKDAR